VPSGTPTGQGCQQTYGERAASLRSLLFGEERERVASETVGSVLVVRRREPF